MSPALLGGDYVVTVKARSFRPGLIYVVDHIDLGLIIKRLTSEADGRYLFTGDNQSSVPSAVIAPVTSDRIAGRVIWIIGPSGIRRSRPQSQDGPRDYEA